MKFRKATIDDLPLLNHISVTAKRYWGYPEEWMQAWMQDLILSPSDLSTMETLVMEFGKNTIGFCAIKDQGEHYEIMHLWILPDFVGKGYGKILLKETLSAFILEQKPIWVLSDPNAELFYKRQGFMTFEKVESFPKDRYLPLMKMNAFFED